ncbi:VG15 protein [Arthrobacter sp. H14]|uniref:VG15 protein n=1 Tax=Arthrobacter sp. H14 TaxID=1312959 RepID=UPI0004AE164E|nr:hypothetical protein [Arthrobacter sp. H14]
MSYEDLIKALGLRTGKIILQLWEAVLDGRITVADFLDLAAQTVALANQQGRATAELALSGFLTAATGQVVVPGAITVTAADDIERLARAMFTITESQKDTVMQLERIAKTEPMEAAARQFSEGIAASPLTTGWVRSMEGDACQLCNWWWREGRVWPKEHRMPTHKGCACTPIPTVSSNIESTKYTRRLARATAGHGQKVDAA